MKSHVFGFALLSVIAIVVGAPAHAQNGSLTRSFVSSTGLDTNACTIAAPCASFAQAYTKVSANGIVAALDPGKYGPLTITGPVTINGNGWAAITGPAGNDAIDINVASGNVTLVGLELDGAGAGLHGIYLTSTSLFLANATLNIRDCVVSNFLDSGIAIQPESPAAFVLNILIENTRSLNNGGSGIRIAPTGTATMSGTITGTTVANNGNDGFDLEGESSLTILTSIANNNGNYGIYDNLNDNTENSRSGFVIVRDTVATYNNTLDFFAPTNAEGWLYHNMFGSFNGNNQYAIRSDGTNQIISFLGNAFVPFGTF
jgi:hypothetical protein